MITITKGDLLKSGERYVAHQVNCMGVMGAGIAKQIREMYPECYAGYKKFLDIRCGMSNILGDIYIYKQEGITIFNLFSQRDFGRGKCHTNYDALSAALIKAMGCIKKDCVDSACSAASHLALPYGIGCGLAGGNINVVNEVIKDASEVTGVDIVMYKL